MILPVTRAHTSPGSWSASLADLLDELLARLAGLAETTPGPRVLVGIAGAPGSGKSTLATALTTRLAGSLDAWNAPAAHVPMDGFHLADAALELLGIRDRKGAPQTFDAAGYAALLSRIAAGEVVWAPSFARDLEQPLAQVIPVPASARIVISEGNYLLLPSPAWALARRYFTEVWYCTVDDAVRQERLVRRHIQFGKSPEAARAWVASVDEPNATLIAASRDTADLMIDMTGVPSNRAPSTRTGPPPTRSAHR